MAKGCETHSRPHNSTDWFGNRKALAVIFNHIKWPALSGALRHEFIVLWSVMLSTLEKGCEWLGAGLVKRALLTPHAHFLSSEEGVRLSNGESLGKYTYKEFWGCVAILLQWLWGRDSQWEFRFRPGRLQVMESIRIASDKCAQWAVCSCTGALRCVFSNKFFPVWCQLFPGT